MRTNHFRSVSWDEVDGRVRHHGAGSIFDARGVLSRSSTFQAPEFKAVCLLIIGKPIRLGRGLYAPSPAADAIVRQLYSPRVKHNWKSIVAVPRDDLIAACLACRLAPPPMFHWSITTRWWKVAP